MFLPATSSECQRVAILPLINDRLVHLHRIVPPFDESLHRRLIVEELRDRLRTLWDTKEEGVAKWRILELQRILHEATINTRITAHKDQPPPLDEPIHQALHFLERNLGQLKKCANPSCESPLFIAAKRTNMYCSGPCASFGAREYMTNRWKHHLKEKVQTRRD